MCVCVCVCVCAVDRSGVLCEGNSSLATELSTDELAHDIELSGRLLFLRGLFTADCLMSL